ncbi:hypothetical protein DSECCO2_598730 [anaerobic digester metagenome]
MEGVEPEDEGEEEEELPLLQVEGDEDELPYRVFPDEGPDEFPLGKEVHEEAAEDRRDAGGDRVCKGARRKVTGRLTLWGQLQADVSRGERDSRK